MKVRGFQKVKRVSSNKDFKLPKRGTKYSACYDFFLHCDVEIPSKRSAIIATGIKSYFPKNEGLFIYPRSSHGFKHGIMLANTVGIIDSDYYNNPDNEGEIFVKLVNTSNKTFKIKKGERFCQALFQKYFTVDRDNAKGRRKSGIGSTGQ